MKDVFKRYSVFVIGLYFLAAGIVLIIRSALGTTPISSINYVLSLNSPLSLGTCTFIINMILILGQFWLIRKNKTRQDIMTIWSIYGAKVDDISPTSMTLELSDTPDRLDTFQAMMRPFSILEVARTGVIAVQKGGGKI